MLELTLLAALALPQGPSAPVVINELNYDDQSADDHEYVELYNASSAPVDISGWSVVPVTPTGPGTVYTVQPGTTLPVGGFWVMGWANVANVDQVITNGTSELFPNTRAGLELRNGSGTVIDRVDWRTLANNWRPAAVEAEGLPGNYVSAGDNLATNQPLADRSTTLQRWVDGADTNDNGFDFGLLPASPGESNLVPPALPYAEPFDFLTAGAPAPLWGKSFVGTTVIDPTASGNGNPNVIPPSPQGGNALVVYDAVGGGDAAMLLTAPVQDVLLECYAYFDTTPFTSSSTDHESWSIGVRGTVDSFAHMALIDPTFTSSTGQSTIVQQTGRTGIAWVYERSNAARVLSLVDFGNGGTDRIVVRSIPIQAGINDGWQRLKIRAIGDRIEGHFGGTFGRNDGVHVSARTTTVRPGGISIGYREALLTNTLWRPVTIDQLVVAPAAGGVEIVGQGFPHSGGTPSIDVSSLPFPDNSDFAIEGSNLVPNAAAVMLTGFVLLPMPFDLGIIGGPAGAFLYVDSVVVSPGMANANGEWNFALPVPNLTVLVGAPLRFQMLTLDVALPQTLPVVTTPALSTSISP